MELTGARALVVGATGGIGRAVTAALVGAGSRVVAAGRDLRLLEELRLTYGVQTTGLELTTRKPESGPAGDPDGTRDPGRAPSTDPIPDPDGTRGPDPALDPDPGLPPGGWNLVVLCAGVGHLAAAADHTDAQLDRLFEVNATAQIRLLRNLIPQLGSGSGARRLAVVGSIAGALGVADESGYAASKAALMIFADSLRVELADAGIGVTVVIPGVVDTGFFERRGVPYRRRFPRPIEPERVADALVEALRHDRSEVVVPRWLRLPIALRACAPGAYWRLARRLA